MDNLFLIISGGPGTYNPEDEAHDQSWSNYVDPPLLRSRVVAQMPTGDIRWLVYEPAYQARWADDYKNQKRQAQAAAAAAIQSRGSMNYLEHLQKKAKEKNWTYVGVSSNEDIIKYINNLEKTNEKILRTWYYGHARNDLWLSLTHDSQNQAVIPGSSAILTVSDISRLNRSCFVQQDKPDAPHKFFGCNTYEFALAWTKHLKVYAEGCVGKVDFGSISKTGGYVTLVDRAEWHRVSPPKGLRALIKKGKDSKVE